MALAYAENYPRRGTEIVLWGVTTGRHREFDWWFRGGAADLFPAQWERLRESLPSAYRDADIVEAYHRLLNAPDPNLRYQAALEWCRWESTTPEWPPTADLASRFDDPGFRMCFARLVTHYVRHRAWLEEGLLIQNAGSLRNIPGIMVSGRFDFQAQLGWAWDLSRVWPLAEHVIVDGAGHDASNEGITRELIRATDRFATPMVTTG